MYLGSRWLSSWQLLCIGNAAEAGLGKTHLGRRAGGRMRAKEPEQPSVGVLGECTWQEQEVCCLGRLVHMRLE